MSRFSKSALVNILELKIDAIELKFGFDRNNGTAQLKCALSNQEAVIAYGEFRTLLNLVRTIDDGSLLR